jgi:hypothetical protein
VAYIYILYILKINTAYNVKIYNTHEPYKCKISIYLFTVHMQSENAGGKTKLCYAKHGKKTDSSRVYRM